MTGLDWFVVVLYFALLATITWWVVAQNLDTADDYFLAGRALGPSPLVVVVVQQSSPARHGTRARTDAEVRL